MLSRNAVFPSLFTVEKRFIFSVFSILKSWKQRKFCMCKQSIIVYSAYSSFNDESCIFAYLFPLPAHRQEAHLLCPAHLFHTIFQVCCLGVPHGIWRAPCVGRSRAWEAYQGQDKRSLSVGSLDKVLAVLMSQSENSVFRKILPSGKACALGKTPRHPSCRYTGHLLDRGPAPNCSQSGEYHESLAREWQ